MNIDNIIYLKNVLGGEEAKKYLKELVEKEVAAVNDDKVTIDEFLKNGGSLDELIDVMNKCEIEEFNGSTKIPASLSETIQQEKYEVSIFEIGYLVSLISSLNLGKKTQIELLEVYYNGLEQSKENGFSTDVLVVENKPKLYELLRDKGLMANVLENERDNKGVKQYEKIEKEISSMVRMIDGEPININPLSEIPIPEMRLYFVDKNYFESIDELLTYCRINNVSTKGLNVIDYYRSFAGRSDVIRKSNSETSMLYTAVDEYGYGLYNNKRSIYRGEFTWEYNHGSIRELYKPFKEKGIVFNNDVYGKIDETHQHILKYCRENNLFNMGRKD